MVYWSLGRAWVLILALGTSHLQGFQRWALVLGLVGDTLGLISNCGEHLYFPLQH